MQTTATVVSRRPYIERKITNLQSGTICLIEIPSHHRLRDGIVLIKRRYSCLIKVELS